MNPAYQANREKILAFKKRDREANRELYLERERAQRLKNRDRINQRRREKRAADRAASREKSRQEYYANREARQAQTKRWKSTHREQQVEYRRTRTAAVRKDPVGREKHIISRLIRQTMLSLADSKPGTRFEQIVGLCKEDFRRKIERQFEPWMNWNNYGTVQGKHPTAPGQCWDLDHIVPISTAQSVEDVIRLNHHENLRPLCSYVNRWRAPQRPQSRRAPLPPPVSSAP